LNARIFDNHLSADKPRESECGKVTIIHAIRIQVTNVDLDRGVILGSNDPVSGGALPGDIEVHRLTLLVLHGDGWGTTAAATAEHRRATINQSHG